MDPDCASREGRECDKGEGQAWWAAEQGHFEIYPVEQTTEAGLLNFQACLNALLIHSAGYNQNGSEEFTFLLILKSQTERGAQICSLKKKKS